MASILALAFALSLAITSAYGLTCYKCDSSENSLCTYGFTSFTYPTAECSAEGSALTSWIPKQCVKIVAKDNEDREFVARGCVPYLGGACNAMAKTLSFFTSLEGKIKDMNCYTCDGDKCNSAQKITGGFTFVGLVLAAIAFLL